MGEHRQICVETAATRDEDASGSSSGPETAVVSGAVMAHRPANGYVKQYNRKSPRGNSAKFGRSSRKQNGSMPNMGRTENLNGVVPHDRQQSFREKNVRMKDNPLSSFDEDTDSEKTMLPDTRVVCSTASMKEEEDALNDSSDEEADYLPGPSCSAKPLFGYPADEDVAPWATKSYYPLSLHGLHDEILDCYYWLRPTPLETSIRYRVYEKIRQVVLDCWKNDDVQVSVFGSLRTRLFLPSSDIDVLVECPKWGDDPKEVKRILQETADRMRQLLHVDQITIYPTAFVPIIKLVDADTRLNVDISFNTIQGVKAAVFMEKVKTEYPVAEPLLLLLKQFLSQRHLNQAYKGGLSSYGLSLMLLHFLQIHAPEVHRLQLKKTGADKLGILLIRFLEVYGQELSYLDVRICVREGAYIPREDSSPETSSPVLLSVSDPLDKRSMLAPMLQFTPQQVYSRNWLKGFALSSSLPTEAVVHPALLTGMAITPSIDLSTLANLPKIALKALAISKPQDIKDRKEKQQEKGKIVKSEKAESGEEKELEKKRDSIEDEGCINGQMKSSTFDQSKEATIMHINPELDQRLVEECDRRRNSTDREESVGKERETEKRGLERERVAEKHMDEGRNGDRRDGHVLRRYGERSSLQRAAPRGVYEPPAARAQQAKKAAAAHRAATQSTSRSSISSSAASSRSNSTLTGGTSQGVFPGGSPQDNCLEQPSELQLQNGALNSAAEQPSKPKSQKAS